MTTSPDRKPFPTRLPPELHKALKTRAGELPDVTMNDLVISGVKHILDGDELTVITTSEMSDAKLDLVVAAIDGEIGALKGTAQHYSNLGHQNLATLLYWLTAEQIAVADPKAASKELVRTADLPGRAMRPIAMALLRAALRHNPANEVAKNRLGQLLYFEGDYQGAAEHLAAVRDRDNHARLFHGWASLHLARAAGNRAASNRARDEIVAALEAWAFGERDVRSRTSWLRQVAALEELGDDFSQTVDELLAYANDNTSWTEVGRAELSAVGGSQTADNSTATTSLRAQG